jgi:hypothetical protein
MPQQQQQQQQQQHKRAASSASGVSGKLLLRVTAPAADGRKVLQAVGALLSTVGQAQAVHVDTAAWKVSCQLAVGASHLQQQQQQRASEAQLPEEDQEPSSKRIRSGVEDPADDGVECSAAKLSAVSSSTASRAGCTTACASVQVEVSVFQQQRGMFDVVAALKGKLLSQQQQQQAGAALLQVFDAVREDLVLMWPVSSLQPL